MVLYNDGDNLFGQAMFLDFFNTYTSNTVAGGGNQHIFYPEQGKIHTGRVFYKIFCAGEFSYSLLFSNIIDSTFANGDLCHKNIVCPSWKIEKARVARCNDDLFVEDFTDPTVATHINERAFDFTDLTFDGKAAKMVAPGEFFCCDPVTLSFDEGDYLCLELTFSGTAIPYHHESVLPVFVKQDDNWVYSTEMPIAGMVGCERPVKARIAYIGDSITQGIGPQYNSYAHWNALLSEKLGNDYAYWNLGLGFARANDMASEGAWAYKAKHNDIVFVCYGVNDMSRFPQEQIEKDLITIVEFLKKENITVILQTVPPAFYSEENTEKWKKINEFIKTTLSEKADMVFDVVPALGKSEEEYWIPQCGGCHPNEERSAVWAEQLYAAVKQAGIL